VVGDIKLDVVLYERDMEIENVVANESNVVSRGTKVTTEIAKLIPRKTSLLRAKA
jgi:hypothetical protein